MDIKKTLIYLASCAVNREIPAAEVLEKTDYEVLCRYAGFHQMAGLIGAVLRTAGIRQTSFEQERVTAIWKERVFDTEKEKLLSRMEEAGIWYMPVKGTVLKQYYPQMGMRQMSDIDILFDKEKAADVRGIMTSLGYETVIYDEGHRDDYRKPAAAHFEMHRVLFTDDNTHKKIVSYYRDLNRLLQGDVGSRYGYHLSNEDFYIYMIAHEYCHYSWGGTGIRSLLDVYVFLKRFSEKLDWAYIKKEVRKLGISDFESENRQLADKIFSKGSLEDLDQEEQNMLQYFLSSGMYGTCDHTIQNEVKRVGKFRYVLRRIFLPLEQVRRYYPFFYRHKLLLPLLPFYRLVKRRDGMSRELKVLRKC